MGKEENSEIQQQEPQVEASDVKDNAAGATPESSKAGQEQWSKEGQKGDKKSKKSQKKSDGSAEKDQKIAELEEKLSSEKDSYLRLMAEFDNFRRRTAQERLELISTASEDVIKGLLPILDDFERAMKALEESTDSAAAKEGTTLIYNKMMSYLKSKGVEAIEAAGKAFDTDQHEAVAQFPVEDPALKGKVYDVVQTGYSLHGKVIRFAKVVVAI